MNPIDFNHKTFRLVQNSALGTANADTLFHYRQNGDLVTAEFSGGSVLHGQILAVHHGSWLEMRYQMRTTGGELKSGRARAEIQAQENGAIVLALDWEWLGGLGETGQSRYEEVLP